MTLKSYSAATVNNDDGAQQVTWVMASGDTAQPLAYAQWADRSIQVEGTFGGATVALQGSNSGNGYVSLTDLQGNTISMTFAGIKQVTEVTAFVKPVISGGDGTTALTITAVVRRSQPLFRQSH